jgi:hypothetical protein
LVEILSDDRHGAAIAFEEIAGAIDPAGVLSASEGKCAIGNNAEYPLRIEANAPLKLFAIPKSFGWD